MENKIAIATTSGRALYLLTSELKKRKEQFITIKPGAMVPLNVEVIITTESEKSTVCGTRILIYNENFNPSEVIEDALQIIRGKQSYDDLIVGVDPGKDFGLAAVGDGIILETIEGLKEEEIAREILRIIERFGSIRKAVKIGNGVNKHKQTLITILDEKLPKDVDIEIVEEEGTTKNINSSQNTRRTKDTYSAIKISMRQGLKITRKNKLISDQR